MVLPDKMLGKNPLLYVFFGENGVSFDLIEPLGEDYLVLLTPSILVLLIS